MPVIPAVRKQKQEGLELEISLGYTARYCLKKENKKKANKKRTNLIVLLIFK
jgi:hypothetical protein